MYEYALKNLDKHMTGSYFFSRRGEGLKVRWPVAGKDSTYSRLVGGPDNKCVKIEVGEKRLWAKDKCDIGNVAPCVKRKCAIPERDSPNAQHSTPDDD